MRFYTFGNANDSYFHLCLRQSGSNLLFTRGIS